MNNKTFIIQNKIFLFAANVLIVLSNFTVLRNKQAERYLVYVRYTKENFVQPQYKVKIYLLTQVDHYLNIVYKQNREYIFVVTNSAIAVFKNGIEQYIIYHHGWDSTITKVSLFEKPVTQLVIIVCGNLYKWLIDGALQ